MLRYLANKLGPSGAVFHGSFELPSHGYSWGKPNCGLQSKICERNLVYIAMHRASCFRKCSNTRTPSQMIMQMILTPSIFSTRIPIFEKSKEELVSKEHDTALTATPSRSRAHSSKQSFPAFMIVDVSQNRNN